jgi:hypothetical protein
VTRTRRLVRAGVGAVALVSITLADASAQAVRWTLAAEPSVTLGLDDSNPAALLQTVVSATRLPDGSILVGDRGDFALKLFGRDGTYQRSFARKGGGPGEVRYLGAMYRCGDSVYTYDIEEGHRFSVFSLDGRYARAFRFRTPPGQQVPYHSACNSAGRFVHIGWEARDKIRPGIHRSQVPVWLSRGDSTAPQAVDSVPGSERWGLTRGGQLVGSRPLPLGKQPVLGIGSASLFVGTADRFQIRAYDFAGRRLADLQRHEAPVAVSRADIRDEVERAVAASPAGEARRAVIEQAYAEITFPTTLAAYRQLVVDAGDFVWVRAFPRGTGDTALWSVFAPSGRLVAEVAVAKHLEVFEIGGDYVLGRYFDPAEAVPQVRLYRLTRTTGTKPSGRGR